MQDQIGTDDFVAIEKGFSYLTFSIAIFLADR